MVAAGVIVVDSSVWIEFFRATGSSAHLTLRSLLADRAPLATTEIVVMEALAGVRYERERRAVREHLFALPMLALHGVLDYERAADLYRRVRSRGVTPRQLTDLLVVVCAWMPVPRSCMPTGTSTGSPKQPDSRHTRT